MAARNIYSSEPVYGDTDNTLLLKIWYWIYGMATDGITATVSEQQVAPHYTALAASSTQIIPTGAKGYSITVLTGTATINGTTAVAGLSISDNNTLASAVTVTTASASTAFVAWNT